MQSRELQTGKLNISSMQTPRIITARSYGRFPRKTQLKDTQHGFLRGRSCLTNLLEYTEITPKWVDDGSLGPLLFLIYINDLEDGIVSNIIKFADDTNIFRREQTRQVSHITGRFK